MLYFTYFGISDLFATAEIFIIAVLYVLKVVIILSGRYAGKKAVIVKSFDEGDPQRPFGHALVAGVERCPLKVRFCSRSFNGTTHRVCISVYLFTAAHSDMFRLPRE